MKTTRYALALTLGLLWLMVPSALRADGVIYDGGSPDQFSIALADAGSSFITKHAWYYFRSLGGQSTDSGLRIRDAVTLSRNLIQDDKLFLYTAKTGTAVYCPLPPFVVEALNAIPASAYFFWSGLSKPKSAVRDWQRSLKRLLILAGVPDGHAHRFRDTFSVELLLAGVPIERVSILLGHQSVRITEKHYAPWVRARQEQLEADVRRTWQTHEPQQGVHGGYTENDARVIPFKSRRKNGGGGGSRTPVRKALRHEAYMLSSIPLFSPAALRMSKKRSRLVRWFSPEPCGPKGSGQLIV